MNKDYNKGKDDIKNAKETVQSGVDYGKGAFDKTKEMASDAASKVSQTASDAWEKTKDTAYNAKEDIKDKAYHAKEYISGAKNEATK